VSQLQSAWSTTETGAVIAVIVLAATAGDVLMAKAMRHVGDLDAIKARDGFGGAVAAVLKSPLLGPAIVFMALSFFSLLLALDHADLSLVGPASASLTFATNALAARIFLKENVNRRRWAAAICVCAGVALLTR
jgi:multidrug transporter EmrE-like cation transporter